MSTDDSSKTPFTSQYITRWASAMENQQYETAVSALDEGLEDARKGMRDDEITHYTNLKNYTQDIVKLLSEKNEISIPSPNCFICGKDEADGAILVAGATGAVCDACIKICVGVIASVSKSHGREIECSFCGKKQSEVMRMIAGVGVFICDVCIRLYSQKIVETEENGSDMIQ